jgi:hypothetical protein
MQGTVTTISYDTIAAVILRRKCVEESNKRKETAKNELF